VADPTFNPFGRHGSRPFGFPLALFPFPSGERVGKGEGKVYLCRPLYLQIFLMSREIFSCKIVEDPVKKEAL